MLLAPAAAANGVGAGLGSPARATASPCAPPPLAAAAPAPADAGEAPAAAPALEAALAPESAAAAAAAAAPEAADAAPDAAAPPGLRHREQEAAAEAALPALADVPEPAGSDSDSGFELLPSPPREVIELLDDSQPSQEAGAGRSATPPLSHSPRPSLLGRRQRSPGEAATQCDICLDALSSSGEHVPVALRCGHVFGQSCVRRWMTLKQSHAPCCPNCKARLVPGEEIRLFASTCAVIVVDRSAATAAEHAAAQADAAAAQVRAELAETRRQLLRLQEQQRTGAAGLSAGGGGGVAATQLALNGTAPPATHTLHKSFRLQHLSCCDLLGDAVVAGSATLAPPAPRLFAMQTDGALAITALQLRSCGGLPAPDARVRDVRLGRAPQSRSALALACLPGRLVLLDLAAGGEARSVAMAAQPLCCAWAADGTDQVFVGDELGAVHVLLLRELERGPLATLAAPFVPGGGPAPCRALTALPPAAGAGLLTLHGAFAACYLLGRPPGAPPAPCLVGVAGSGVAGLAWDPAACTAVASRIAAGALRHATLAPLLRDGAGGGGADRVWHNFADLSPTPGPPPSMPPHLQAVLRTAVVPGPGGAGSLFAAPDAARSAVALWHLPGRQQPGPRPAVPPLCWLTPHSDGPVLDVRCDAEAHLRGDGASMLLSLSAGELHVHARAAATN